MASASGRERAAVELGDRRDHRVLHLGRDVDVDLAHPRLLAVSVVPLPGGVGQTVELRAAMVTPAHTSGMVRPSSACQSSGGRSSRATTIPTWFTGLFVNARIARSAVELPGTTRRRRFG